ncbi:MAG: hypothetical protein ABIJ09_15115 [Pseudomonadota bacterium]
MNERGEDQGSEPVRVGSDVVTLRPDGLQILSRHEMQEWQPTTYRKTWVRYQGIDYTIDAVEAQHGGVLYWLRPLTADDKIALPGRVYEYDASFVEARDAMIRNYRATQGLRWLVLPWYPLLGFLPSSAKFLLLDRFGLHPLPLTKFSLGIQYMVLAITLVTIVIEAFASTLGAATGATDGNWLIPPELVQVLALLSAVLTPDMIVRSGRLIQGSVLQYGLYEWLFRRLDALQ